MTEFRFEPLSKRWVIAGGDRSTRPNDFCDRIIRRSDVSCPFCAGHEDETPAAAAEYSAKPNGPWTVRVVPNKFPAVNGKLARRKGGVDQSPFVRQPGQGLHEVIIESPRHVVDLLDLTEQELKHTFQAYRDRLRAVAESGLSYCQIFKNVGADAGASLEHSHSQVIGLPWIPGEIQEKLAAAEEHFRQTGKSLISTLIEAEEADGSRILAADEHFVAWCPFASRFAFECRLAPRKHLPDFRTGGNAEIGRLAKFVRDLVRCIKRAIGGSGYNLVLYTQPFDTNQYDHYHWHWEILPRLAKQAGFELGTGCYINPLLPERAADLIRQAAVTGRSAREN